ncbi:hypothetical protein WICPIJ_009173 [Wickerhamomyces pijperi]|uniref:TLC domain-containing protein n=1 Tax=Wickerhamomyces pijperi TaxID=599730 RepID=A0A9P8PPW2_WICPI|nr:hypothetical protein WICPIJ_009173 [Wickerhamomyces pijperi]
MTATSSIEKNQTFVAQRKVNSEKSLSSTNSQHKQTEADSITKDGDDKEEYKISLVDKWQLWLSSLFILSTFLLDRLPLLTPYTSKFLYLQYRYEDHLTETVYGIGVDDFYFVFSGVIIMTFIRSFTMLYVLRPITRALNINSHKAVQRFLEQGWYLVYYSSSFFFGLYIYYNSSYFLSLDNIWIGWPYNKMTSITKTYYLMELACWVHQLFILNIEAKRKDYVQMFTHHIITISLVGGSYFHFYTRIGNVILVIMDFVDIFLSLAKVLKYCGFQFICDLMFLNFLISWIVLRCGLFNYIWYHTAFKARDLIRETECLATLGVQPCWTSKVFEIFLVLLGALQVLMIIWLFLIIKVAYKVIAGYGAEDVRSDDED